MPIIGIDLPQHRNILIDTRKERLIYENTSLSVCVTSFPGCILFIVTVRYTIYPYNENILGKYPELYQTRPTLPFVTNDVAQHITTIGLHVFSKAHRLAS